MLLGPAGTRERHAVCIIDLVSKVCQLYIWSCCINVPGPIAQILPLASTKVCSRIPRRESGGMQHIPSFDKTLAQSPTSPPVQSWASCCCIETVNGGSGDRHLGFSAFHMSPGDMIDPGPTPAGTTYLFKSSAPLGRAQPPAQTGPTTWVPSLPELMNLFVFLPASSSIPGESRPLPVTLNPGSFLFGSLVPGPRLPPDPPAT
jgi:hypothetical protein